MIVDDCQQLEGGDVIGTAALSVHDEIFNPQWFDEGG